MEGFMRLRIYDVIKEGRKKNLFPFLQRLFITSISDNIPRVRNLIIKRKSEKEWNEAMIKTHRHVMCSDIFFHSLCRRK